MVLICISELLMMVSIFHVFIWHLNFFGEMPLHIFCLYFMGLLFSSESSLYSLYTGFLSDICSVNIPVWLAFH